MSRSDYGFSRLNSSFNSRLSGNSSNSINNNAARVISIVLGPLHPKFEILGGWSALGAIEYDFISNPTKGKDYPVAYPLDSNIKILPLINEIVLIHSSLDPGVDRLEKKTKITSNLLRNYYTNKISVWNHPHHNGYSFRINDPTSTQNKSYNQTQAGSVSVVSNTPAEINLGETFKEKIDVYPLLPFEGDLIIEGRWNNSIRLSSTVMSSASLFPNDWSKEGVGTNGDPIVIIKNGTGKKYDKGWEPIIEDINYDISSMYLTSTQNIPLKAKSTDYTSYSEPPTTPDQYSGPQILLNSGRLVFNSYTDHILLSSAKSINLNSQESVNIDTKKFITQADKIFLGKEDLTTEPLLLGNTTSQLLRDLISSVKELATVLQKLTSDPVAPNTPATFTTLLVPTTKALITLRSLEKQLGTSPESCTITSKRNFTL